VRLEHRGAELWIQSEDGFAHRVPIGGEPVSVHLFARGGAFAVRRIP
jgi:hypothetical protein